MRKILSLILYLFLLFSLIACHSNDTTNSSLPSQLSEQKDDETKIKEWYSKNKVKFTTAELEKAINTQYVLPKNIILMIGDGMGINDIILTNRFGKSLFDFGLVIDHLPNQGFSITDSAQGVTDSAAASTALSTGEKAKNGRLGIDKNGNYVENTSELARHYNKKVGIVTNDAVFGATPSGFVVHCTDRSNTDEICQKLLTFAPDVLIGSSASIFTESINKSDYHRILLEDINLATDQAYWEGALNNDPDFEKAFFGFMNVSFSYDSSQLAQATELALNRLENKDGFFLMVESAGTDKAGHNKIIDNKIHGVSSFNKAVAVALKYCMNNPDTILIVTSDHETGGVTLPNGDYELSDSLFTTDQHTNAKVGVFALGYGTEYFNNKTVDNTDIAKFIHAAIKGETYK